MTLCKPPIFDLSIQSEFSFENIQREPLRAFGLVALILFYSGGFLLSLLLLSNLGLALVKFGLISQGAVLIFLFSYTFAIPVLFFYRNVFRKESHTDLFKLYKKNQNLLTVLFGQLGLFTPYPTISKFKLQNYEFKSRVVGVEPPPPKSST